MNSLTAWFQQLSNKQIALVFFCLGVLIYANSLFHGFIGDDIKLIVVNPLVHSLSNIPQLVVHGLFPSDGTQTNNYYRPLFSATSAILYFLSVGQPDGFHAAQVAIHSANALLIFLILTFFFTRGIAFFLSILFLVHPINTEAVVYIAARQEPLFLFFGLLALYLTHKKFNSVPGFFLVGLLELLALLSKETAIVFLFLIPAFNYVFQKNKLFPFYAIQSVSVLAVYLLLRFAVAGVYFNKFIVVPIATLSFWERVVSIPKIILFYLGTFFYPKNLVVAHNWVVKSPSLVDFYLPLIFMLTFFALLSWFGLVLYKKESSLFKSFVFFFAWFVLGLGIHVQIFPLDQTVADRYFYFPIVGLLGLAGVAIKYFKIPNRFGLAALAAAVVLVMAFSARVIVRNTDWKTPATLYSHDIRFNKDSYQLEKAVAGIAFSQGDIPKAEMHLIRSTELFPSERTYSALCYFYLHLDNVTKAVEACQAAFDHNSNIADSWANLAMAEYKAGNKESALKAAKKAYEISPSGTHSAILSAIENNHLLKIDFKIR